MKAEAKDQASLKAEEETQFSEELRLNAEKKEQVYLKSEYEMPLADELRLKDEARCFCGVVVEI